MRKPISHCRKTNSVAGMLSMQPGTHYLATAGPQCFPFVPKIQFMLGALVHASHILAHSGCVTHLDGCWAVAKLSGDGEKIQHPTCAAFIVESVSVDPHKSQYLPYIRCHGTKTDEDPPEYVMACAPVS